MGVKHCPSCERVVGKQTAQQIVESILELPEGSRILLLAPLVQNRKGEYRDLLADVAKRGFSRARVDGMVHQLSERLALDKKLKHDIELVVDRLLVKDGIRARLTDSVETALREGKGTLIVADADKEQKVGPGIDPEEYKRHDRFSSELNACHACGLSFGELAPQGFSFNSPLGSCPDCQGLGTRAEMDPDLIVPDPSRTIREGAVEPWASGMERGEGWTFEFVEPLSRALRLDLDTPFAKLPRKDRAVVMYGAAGAGGGGGGGAAPPPPPARGAHAWIAALDLRGNEARIGDELLKEIRNRLKFLLDVGLGYLTLDRPGPSLSGGESQRIRLASQMGSELTGVIYI